MFHGLAMVNFNGQIVTGDSIMYTESKLICVNNQTGYALYLSKSTLVIAQSC